MKQDSNLYCSGFNGMLYHWSYSSYFAERKGLEPLNLLQSTVFKTASSTIQTLSFVCVARFELTQRLNSGFTDLPGSPATAYTLVGG